jgi:hypothetical protein
MVIATVHTLKFSVRSPWKLLTLKVQSKRHRVRRIPITKCNWGNRMDMLGIFSQNRLVHREDGCSRITIVRNGWHGWVTDGYLLGCSCMCFLAHGGIFRTICSKMACCVDIATWRAKSNAAVSGQTQTNRKRETGTNRRLVTRDHTVVGRHTDTFNENIPQGGSSLRSGVFLMLLTPGSCSTASSCFSRIWILSSCCVLMTDSMSFLSIRSFLASSNPCLSLSSLSFLLTSSRIIFSAS